MLTSSISPFHHTSTLAAARLFASNFHTICIGSWVKNREGVIVIRAFWVVHYRSSPLINDQAVRKGTVKESKRCETEVLLIITALGSCGKRGNTGKARENPCPLPSFSVRFSFQVLFCCHP